MVKDHREGERGTPHVGIHKLGGRRDRPTVGGREVSLAPALASSPGAGGDQRSLESRSPAPRSPPQGGLTL